MSFTYGTGFPTLWRHENLNDETHEWIKDEFAAVPLTFFRQMARCVRKGNLVSVDGGDELPRDFTAQAPHTDARFAFLAGERNRCFLPESQQRTFRFFEQHAPGKHSLARASRLRAPRRLHRQEREPGRVSDHAGRARALHVIPRRIKRQSGRYALVDGIPVPAAGQLGPNVGADGGLRGRPCQGRRAPARERVARRRLWSRALLLITVINYTITDIGKYIEFSIGIACTHGTRPAPRFLPPPAAPPFGIGQYVLDLPVSTEISVKGGKGIWGMPKHQANLDFVVADDSVSSQYDKDG